MQQMVLTILQQYGSPMILSREGEITELKGFFQPVRSKSWQSLVSLDTPLGEVPLAQYIYIGPAQPPACNGGLLTVGQKQYWIRRAEVYEYAGEALYSWGLCVEKGECDTWGSRS